MPPIQPARKLLATDTELMPPIIHGLLRQDEVLTWIMGSKSGKSWAAMDLAISVATGARWLGTFQAERRRVLYVNYELHGRTYAHRLRDILLARGMRHAPDQLDVWCLRGAYLDVDGIATELEGEDYGLVIIDPIYCAYPAVGSSGTFSENSNADMAQLYRKFQRLATQVGGSLVVVHHASKGNQAGKDTADVGAGAGAIARASDAHLIGRPHEVDDAVVLDARLRSWPPISPMVVRWEFPLWKPADDLDPTALLATRPPERRAKTGGVAWTPERFAERFVPDTPKRRTAIVAEARAEGLGKSEAENWLQRAIDAGLAHQGRDGGANTPVMVSRHPLRLVGGDE